MLKKVFLLFQAKNIVTAGSASTGYISEVVASELGQDSGNLAEQANRESWEEGKTMMNDGFV